MRKKRILLFAQDGSGLGHLSRICRIAKGLQDFYSILIVTGKREIFWMIPDKCEFICVPSWKTMRKKMATKWNREVWLDVEDEEAIKMIGSIYLEIVNSFRPDVIINDYLPYGKFGELTACLSIPGIIKYLLIRGVVDTSDKKAFYGAESQNYEQLYDRILYTCDQRIIEPINQLHINPAFQAKVNVIGYVMPELVTPEKVRVKFGIQAKSKWIVCSAGGGMNAEPFLVECVLQSASFPEITFDVVFGPYSKDDLVPKSDQIPTNCRIHKTQSQLPSMLASADICIINGGYNTLVESIYYGNKILVFPNQSGLDDEQITHSEKLRSYCDIEAVSSIKEIGIVLQKKLNETFCKKKTDLNYNAINNLLGMVLSDLQAKTQL